MNQARQDPLGYEISLTHSVRYYPMGFPLQLETNDARILALAAALWSRWPSRPGPAPVRFRIFVADRDAAGPVAPAMPRGQAHLVSVIPAPDNFAICDVAASFAFASLTRDVAADAEFTRYHFLEPLTYLMIDAAHLAPLHASSIAWKGNAVVLCGASGAGKTSLAYGCGRAGWTYLSDDATHVIRGRSEPWVAGRPYRIRFRASARDLFPELRGFTPQRRANGKLDIEVETHKLNLTVAPESRVSHVVFLDRTNAAEGARLDSWPLSKAARQFEELICYGDERIRRAQKKTLAKLLELPVLRLCYRDTASAESALRELVE